MSESVQFSDAAKLFAENYNVVEAMRAAFDAEAGAFYDHVRDFIRAENPGLKEQRTHANRYWWLGEREKRTDSLPQIYFDIRKVDVVHPGKWELYAAAPDAGPDELAFLANVALAEELSSYCIPGSGGSWSLFSISISTAQESPQEMALKIGRALSALEAAHQEFQSNRDD